jgi:hypothetical protein
MSTLEQPITAVEIVPEAPIAPGWWDWIDRAATAINQRLNPILVKEARQALKSKQFTVTFTLVLAAAWGWTMLGVAMVGPSIYYGSSGMELFTVYFVILSFALTVVVPFSAFWSLATERADGTYELLSIATLTPRQVITGKLASAMLQMIVYYSALAPCIAFTYLLRGIDVAVIGLVLFYMFHASLGLSAIGLLVATATSERHWQIVMSVFMVAGLLAVFFLSWSVPAVLWEVNGVPLDDVWFWVGNCAVLSVFWGYFALVVQAASAQLDFPSNNRSTKLRVVMLFQQLLFLGWMAFALFESAEREIFIPLLIFSGIHWWVMGAFMVGEAGDLSMRVRRTLPQSFLGRAFFTWFNPGSGSGYIFTLASYIGLVTTVIIGENIWSRLAHASYMQSRVTWMADFDPLVFGLTMFLYLMFYLGLTRLILMVLRRAGWGTMFMSLLTCILLVIFGCGVPLSIHLMSTNWRADYSIMEVTNPFWTLAEMSGNQLPIADQLQVMALLGSAAGFIFLLNLPSIAREVQQVRAAMPKRVSDDNAAMRPAAAPEKKNPWDDGIAAAPADL